MTIQQQNQNALNGALAQNQQLLSILDGKKADDFKNNFLELASNDYLVGAVAPKELMTFCLNITKLGININPVYKEVYIIPFKTKVRNSTVMLPQAIMPLAGMQELAYRAGFYLRLYEVWDFGNDIVSEKEMNRSHQRKLNTSNPKWVDEHFVGFDVELIDTMGKIPPQYKFVEVAYLRDVTKTLKSPNFKVQTWRHKAVRRAFGDFFIPHSRNLDVLEKLDHMNNEVLESDTPKVNPKTLEQLGVKTIEKDGLLIADNKTVYGKTDYLKELGFKYHDGSWVKENDIEDTNQPTPNSNVTQTSIKKRFSMFLIKHELPINRQKEFVLDYLGIDANDTKQMEDLLNQPEELISMVSTFLSEPKVELVG